MQMFSKSQVSDAMIFKSEAGDPLAYSDMTNTISQVTDRPRLVPSNS